jgi:hypothetical protein
VGAAATAVDGELILVSSVDGGKVTVTMAAVTYSSTLDLDSGKLDCSHPVQVHATAAAISKGMEWIQHEWHRKESPLAKDAQAAFISDFVTGLAKDCVLYVAVLKMADFFALDGLVSALLITVNDDAMHQACLDSFPPLASLVAPLGDLAEEEIAERLSRVIGLSDRVALLSAMITETGASKLTWVQLEKCDGLYLKCDCDFDDNDEWKTASSKPEDKTACLGLRAWTTAERERRQVQTDAVVAANKVARATYKTAATRGALDGELAGAVYADDLVAAEAAFAKGAALDVHQMGEDDDDAMAWLTTNDLPDRLDSSRDALPLICLVADNIHMFNWLLDNGADVNAR